MVLTTKRRLAIQKAADEFFDNCQSAKYGINDIFSECERRNYKLVRYPIGERAMLGFAQIRDNDKIIFSNSSVRLSREIFTIAHEIGHLVLHMKDADFFVDDQGTFSDDCPNAFEREANYFAACLLMPEDRVRKFLLYELDDKYNETWSAYDVAKLMTAFNASFEMVLNRLIEIDAINKTTRTRLEAEKNVARVTRLLQVTGGNSELNEVSNKKRIPGQYMDWVLYNYNHGVIPEDTLRRSLSYFELTMDDIRDELTLKEEEEDDLDALIGGIDN